MTLSLSGQYGIVLPAINQNETIMSITIEYTSFCELEDKVDALFDTYNRVEYIGEAGANRAQYFCAM